MVIFRITNILKVLSIGLIILLSSCGGGDDTATGIEEFIAKFNLNAQQSSSGLYFTLIEQGDGEPIDETKFLILNVTQFDLNNNIISRTDADFPAALGLQELVPGLQEGLQLLNNGGRANFYIPPALSGGSIASGALIFGVEVIEVYDSLDDYNEGEILKYITANDLIATRTDEGLYVVITEPGDSIMPTADSRVTVDYHGTYLSGIVFDSSVDRGAPASFRLDEVIQGWTLGIPLFGKGGKGTILIPSNLAYGAQGNASIPSNYPLAFEIELIAIE